MNKTALKSNRRSLKEIFNELDLFNFMYSIGAVIILLGVIAKFMEWGAQDYLLLIGLCSEALVFILSSVSTKKDDKQYQWEKVFPQLTETSSKIFIGIKDNENAVSEGFERVKQMQLQFFTDVEIYLKQLQNFNHKFSNDINGQYLKVNDFYEIVDSCIKNLTQLDTITKNLSSTADTKNLNGLEEVNESFIQLKSKIQGLAEGIESSANSISTTTVAVNDFNDILNKINSIKQLFLNGEKN